MEAFLTAVGKAFRFMKREKEFLYFTCFFAGINIYTYICVQK